MVKVIIFDLQGTLVENGVFPSPLKQAKYILRINAPFSDFVMRFERAFMTKSYPTLKDAFNEVCKDFNIQVKDFFIEKLVGIWNKNKLLSTLHPDVIDTLKDLKKDYKLVLAANIDSASKDIVTRFGLDKYFDEILLSCDTGKLKSDKAFYKSLDVEPSEVLVVGDGLESDMATAKQLGFDSILVDRNNRREYEKKLLNLKDIRNFL